MSGTNLFGEEIGLQELAQETVVVFTLPAIATEPVDPLTLDHQWCPAEQGETGALICGDRLTNVC